MIFLKKLSLFRNEKINVAAYGWYTNGKADIICNIFTQYNRISRKNCQQRYLNSRSILL